MFSVRMSCKNIFSNLMWHNTSGHTLQLCLREITKESFVACSFPNTQSSGIFKGRKGQFILPVEGTTQQQLIWSAGDQMTQSRLWEAGRQCLLGQENSSGVHCVVSCNFSIGMHTRRYTSLGKELQRDPPGTIWAQGGW